MKPKKKIIKEINWELLVDHYHRVVESQYKREGVRESLFWISFVTVSLLLLDITQPPLLRGILTNLATKFSVPESTASFFLLRPLLWVGTTYVLLKYFQIVLLVDREYDYVYELEEQLGTVFPKPLFRKEGMVYEKSQSRFRDYIWNFYRYFIPFVFLFGIFLALVEEINAKSGNYFDFAFSAIVILGILLAWFSVQKRKASGK